MTGPDHSIVSTEIDRSRNSTWSAIVAQASDNDLHVSAVPNRAPATPMDGRCFDRALASSTKAWRSFCAREFASDIGKSPHLAPLRARYARALIPNNCRVSPPDDNNPGGSGKGRVSVELTGRAGRMAARGMGEHVISEGASR